MSGRRDGLHRALTAEEIAVLESRRCRAGSWDDVRVIDPFDPSRIDDCRFSGIVEIGAMSFDSIPRGGERYPVGLYGSVIESCRLGANVSVSNVRLLRGYTVGEKAVLCTIDELTVSLKEAGSREDEIWIKVANENGGRAVMLFPSMTAGDALLWSRDRDNSELQSCYYQMAREAWKAMISGGPGIGRGAIIKNCSMLHDVVVHEAACLEGITRLDRIVALSSQSRPSVVVDACILRNGVIGYGNTVRGRVTAEQFLTNANVALSNGLQLEHSVIGDNAHLSCGEVLSVLTFPFHEQHHKSSFLCAAVLEGQSNIAAGTVIGSNHNSRKGDGEMRAERGFWPGLSSTYKYNSRFASFTLATTGSYTAELYIPYPFSLVSRDDSNGSLQIIPAYWFRYNMYALERNRQKFASRDCREAGPTAQLRLVMHYLSPDTVEEMLNAMEMLEKGSEEVRILKAAEGRESYLEMVRLWAADVILKNIDGSTPAGLLKILLNEKRSQETGNGPAWENPTWTNLGGQLFRTDRIRLLKTKITSGEIDSWDQVHRFYNEEAERYPRDELDYAAEVIGRLFDVSPSEITEKELTELLEQALVIKKKVLHRTKASREKDYNDPYHLMLYRDRNEMDAVLGPLDQDPVIAEAEREAAVFSSKVREILGKGA